MKVDEFIKTKNSLMGLIYDINENEIMSHVENGTLKQWITAWRRCAFENTDKITLSPIEEDNTMNIIFAKHDALNKEYLFEVPDGMHPVKGDVLWVDTSKGETVATATSDMISGNGVEQIADKFGAYFPLKKVLAYANRGIETYIRNIAYEKVVRYCCGEQKNVHAIDDLPF